MTDETFRLRAELAEARRDLDARIRASERLDRRLADARNDARAMAQANEKLNVTLREARASLLGLREQLEALGRPPAQFGRVLAVVDGAGAPGSSGSGQGAGPSASTVVDVAVGGRQLRVDVSPEVPRAELAPGASVLLNEALLLVGVAEPDAGRGEVATLRAELGERLLVAGASDDEAVVTRAAALTRVTLNPGDTLLVDRRAGIALERLRSTAVEPLLLEATPDVTYDDIGGLDDQLEAIRDAIELPFAHPEAFARYGLRAPKGVLLYGPPGCGKTMVAKAVANAVGSHFLNIAGPELLDKYVGETERQIRAIFTHARTLAADGRGVVVFFDEMDSLFRTRGSGVSSDVESTIVPQLLAELDGVEALTGVVVIGATNREDLIDPAILRPGRLDVKIRLERPTRSGAEAILRRYLVPSLPLSSSEVDAAGSASALVGSLIESVLEALYARTPATEFVEVTYASGARETLHVADFVSGAMLANIVARAKTFAIKDELAGGTSGLERAHVQRAVAAELAENETLPNTTNPDDWARVSGRRGERITFLRTLHDARAMEV